MVCSPDTLTGRIRAVDEDGLDSLWLTVDDVTRAEDGLLEQVFDAPFRLPIRSGHPVGQPIAAVLEARDVVGFSHAVSDTTRVILCAPTNFE